MSSSRTEASGLIRMIQLIPPSLCRIDYIVNIPPVEWVSHFAGHPIRMGMGHLCIKYSAVPLAKTRSEAKWVGWNSDRV